LDLKFTQAFKEQGLNFIAEVRLFVMVFMVDGSGANSLFDSDFWNQEVSN